MRAVRVRAPMPRIAVIQIGVTDMTRAVAFYRDALGFEVDSEEAAPAFVTLRNDGAVLLLAAVAKSNPARYPDEAQVLLNLASDDLEKDIARLKRAGVDLVHEEPQPAPVGRYVAFRDPSGNVHELIQFDRGA